MQGLLPILTCDHILMSALAPQFTCPSASSLAIPFPSPLAGWCRHDWLLSNAPPRLRAGALQQGNPGRRNGLDLPGGTLASQSLLSGNFHLTLTLKVPLFGTPMMCQTTYSYLGNKNIFTDDVGLYLRGNWKSQRKLVPTFYQWWCALRDLLGNYNIQVLISSPECRQCVPPTLKKNNGENIIVFVTPRKDWEWATV